MFNEFTGEFVLGLYNFCTFDNVSLCRFAFQIYDLDGSGYLDHDEIEKIVKDLYGRRGFKTNASAQKCIQQLKNMEWYSGSTLDMGTGEIDFQSFLIFSKNHPTLLYPAFQMQYDLQSQCLGSGCWQCAAEQRRSLEKIIGCSDNDLLDVLQAMHAEEEQHLFEQERGQQGSVGTDPAGATVSPTNVPFEDFVHDEKKHDSALVKNNRINKYKIKQANSKGHRGGGGGSGGGGRSHLRAISTNKSGKSSAEREKKKKEQKVMLKAQYKKELRAERKATAKGYNLEKAKEKSKQAGKQVKKQHLADKKRQDKKMLISAGKSNGLKTSDGTLAWQCRRCKMANYAVDKCTMCGHSRSLVRNVQGGGPPLSPKRKVSRRMKTSF